MHIETALLSIAEVTTYENVNPLFKFTSGHRNLFFWPMENSFRKLLAIFDGTLRTLNTRSLKVNIGNEIITASEQNPKK